MLEETQWGFYIGLRWEYYFVCRNCGILISGLRKKWCSLLVWARKCFPLLLSLVRGVQSLRARGRGNQPGLLRLPGERQANSSSPRVAGRFSQIPGYIFKPLSTFTIRDGQRDFGSNDFHRRWHPAEGWAGAHIHTSVEPGASPIRGEHRGAAVCRAAASVLGSWSPTAGADLPPLPSTLSLLSTAFS